MTQSVLSRQQLNRATLARQWLLERSPSSTLDAIEHLVGLQAQTTASWYTGLWSRLVDFDPKALGAMLEDRRVVRINIMRATIHLVTADDCLGLRPLVQTVLERNHHGAFGRYLQGVDQTEVARVGRELVEETPLTPAELGVRLAELWPDRHQLALANTVKARLPLVHVPPRGVWGKSGPSALTTAETWLGRSLESNPSIDTMVLRYLGAFGPASVRDIQMWSTLTRLAEVVDRLRPRLDTFRDENGAELFDLPSAPRPPANVEAPPRFLYDFDSLFLSHADRIRFFSEENQPEIVRDGASLISMVPVDGTVGATWAMERDRRRSATVTITPLRRLDRSRRRAITLEAERMLAFAAADFEVHRVRLVS